MNRIISIISISISIISIFFLPLLRIDLTTYLLLSTVLIGLSILIYFTNKALFPTILFFALTFLTRPLNYNFTQLLHLEFSGTYFLIPIVVFTIIIITIPSLKQHISWWRRDTIDKNAWLIIVGLSVVSGWALFIWGQYIAEDLSKFTDTLPDVTVIWILLNGVGFALLNSIAEEYLSRGMLCNGLEKLISNKYLIIIVQALVFSFFHYNGFPGGPVGMIMVFVWSLALGIVRYRTKGLMGVFIGHFFADLTIYFTLYGLK